MAWADKATNVMGVDGPISRQYSGYEHYFYKNIHGDVIFAFTSNHWRSSEYSYDAYGNGKVSYDYFSANPNPIRYSGQYYDTESRMTYLRARYYDPYQRRFISEDPVKDGLNWYSYCAGNPLMFVDPSGLEIRCSTSDSAEILRMLRELTDDEIDFVEIEDENGVKTGNSRLVITKTYDTDRPVGQRLISDLVKSNKTIEIGG